MINEEVVVENIPMRNVPPPDMPEWAKQMERRLEKRIDEGFKKQDEFNKWVVKQFENLYKYNPNLKKGPKNKK
ncbi:MAG: hypothetical protein HUJ52_03310 [Malacoplasma sp.]|nr:hypothetical protein [Malacoplasma sp.]